MPLNTAPPTPIYGHVTTEVAVKDSLEGGAWTVVPHLFADSLLLRVNAYDQAVLSYEFGAEFARPAPAAAGFALVQPLEILGKFVRIRVYNYVTGNYNVEWVGYVVGDTTERGATKSVLGQLELTGRGQRFEAVGLEWFLDRRQIDSAVMWDATANTVFRIQRPLVFNGGSTAARNTSVSTRANKATEDFAFSGGASAPEVWNAEDIALYLTLYHSEAFPVPLDLGTLGFSNAIEPTIETAGRTTFEVLNELFHPRRGLCWWLDYNDTSQTAQINVDSLLRDDVTLPGSAGTMPKNSNQIELDFDTQIDAENVLISRNLSGRYNQVIARGARLTSTFTLGFGDGTLQKDWRDAEETEYKAGASGVGGYGALTDEQKQKANDAFRASEKYARVYSHFRIPPDWDGRTGDGSGVSALAPALPEISSTGSVLGGSNLSLAGLRMLNHTLLKEGWDYTNAANPTSTTPTATEPEFTRPFAIVLVQSSPPAWQYTTAIHRSDFMGEDNAHTINYNMRMHGTAPGVEFLANKVAHGMADTHWAGAEPTQHAPEVNYEELRCTVCAEADLFAEGVYPTSGVDDSDEKLTLYVSDQYRLDYLAPNTVYGLNNGTPLKTNGGRLRDDRAFLTDLARLAYVWYADPHRVLSFSMRQILTSMPRGAMITTIGIGAQTEAINTVIGQVGFDFNAGTTSIQTIADQFDARAFA